MPNNGSSSGRERVLLFLTRKIPPLFAWFILFAIASAIVLSAAPALADEPAKAPLSWEQFRDATSLDSTDAVSASPLGTEGNHAVNYLWMMVCAILVFWMQAGFALVEAGLTRAKNVCNIMMKNLLDFAIGSLAFWMVGFGLMFGVTNGLFGTTGFFLNGYQDDTWSWTFLMFQTVFCATAATIVSGAMAERTKFSAYLVYSLLISVFIYPVFGSWAWGSLFKGGGWLQAPEGGFLARMGLPGLIDFAGSTVVHSIGGWAALAGAMVLGPRLGKYGKNGEIRQIRGHNMAFATLGVFILWMGWFGFNPGSTGGVTGGTDPFGGVGKAVGLIAVNTNLAACAGALAAMIMTWKGTGKPDISMTLNGVLGGLVSITAGCANVSPLAAVVIGALGGVVVVKSVNFFDRVKIDDPVGAVSVHGVCGAWGTLATGIFNHAGFSGAQLATQAIAVVTGFVWSFGLAFVMFKAIKATMGLRVAREEEIEGLDLSEHGAEGYPSDIAIGPEPASEPAAVSALETADAKA